MSHTGFRASVRTYAARFRRSPSVAASTNDGIGVPFIPVRNRRYILRRRAAAERPRLGEAGRRQRPSLIVLEVSCDRAGALAVGAVSMPSSAASRTALPATMLCGDGAPGIEAATVGIPCGRSVAKRGENDFT